MTETRTLGFARTLLTLLTAALVALLYGGPAGAVAPAAGGAVLPAADVAVATVVGRVADVQRLDQHGYVARLEVERLVGGSLLNSRVVRIAWEELASARPPRFRERDRILVVLSAFPNASIWRGRLPEAASDMNVLGVAAAGDAFMAAPGAPTLDALAVYLALPAASRTDRDGATALAHLAATAPPALATLAVVQLDSIAGLDAKLSPAAVDDLRRILTEGHDPIIQRAVVSLATQHRLQALRPTLNEQARTGSPLEAQAVEALAALDGGLSLDRVNALLKRRAPAVRAAAIRGAPANVSEDRLATLLRRDPSPLVRAAAVDTLLRIYRERAVALVASALGDGDASVRTAAARGIGNLGAAGVASLLAANPQVPPSTAAGMILALDSAGQAGSQALRDLAAHHPDEQVRVLARLALGQAPGHTH